MIESRSIFLGSILSAAAAFTSCSEDQSFEGILVDKEYQPERTWTMPDGRSVRDDEDHILRVEDCGMGDTEQCQTFELYVPKNVFETAQLGEWIRLVARNDIERSNTNIIEN